MTQSGASNPLSGDPECAQFASLIIRQAQEENFGFSKRQIRNLTSTSQGQVLWNTLNSCFKNPRRKFDFGQFCRDLCSPQFNGLKQCFKTAKIEFPEYDPRQICYREVWDMCKQIEYTWTDLVFKTTENGIRR